VVAIEEEAVEVVVKLWEEYRQREFQ